MGIQCGIVGLPNVGKSTLFNALTKAQIAAENYPFCTIDPNVGVVGVPDPRLTELAAVAKPERVLPAAVEFVDIAGLVAGASKGEGLGNQFLAHIRETDAIAHVVRCFEDDDVTHVAGRVDPIDDIEVIETELMLADLETVQKAFMRAERAAKTNEKAAVARRDVLRELHLITAKPVMYVANVAEGAGEDDPLVARVREYAAAQGAEVVAISAAIEAEIAQLPEDERADFLKELGLEEPGLNRLI